MITGHITICKVFGDGTKEVILDKDNIITAGLGNSVSNILTGEGSNFVEDYTPRYFQIGTSAISFESHSASSFFYQLSSPISWEQYGPNSNIEVKERLRTFLASSTDGINYTENLFVSSQDFSSITYSGIDEYFGRVNPNKITKYYLDSFTSEIVLDENTANGIDITEIGLFIRNPLDKRKDSPLLIAYKKFGAVSKTKEFSLVINWTVGFLGQSSSIDNFFSPGGEEEVRTRLNRLRRRLRRWQKRLVNIFRDGGGGNTPPPTGGGGGPSGDGTTGTTTGGGGPPGPSFDSEGGSQVGSGDDGWPLAPPQVIIEYVNRDTTFTSQLFRVASTAWEFEPDGLRRSAQVGVNMQKVAFRVFFEQIKNINATRVTVAAMNGLNQAATGDPVCTQKYFIKYKIRLGGGPLPNEIILDNILGHNQIPPRFALIRRTSVGPDSDILKNWTYTPTDFDLNASVPGFLQFLKNQTIADNIERTSLPGHEGHGGVNVNLGPYKFFWPDHSLNDSHGGYGVGPLTSGPDDYLQFPEGKVNRELMLLREFQRPIWMLNADHTPYVPFEAQWLGRTTEHEFSYYNYDHTEFDSSNTPWCQYSPSLLTSQGGGYKFADGTHMSRSTGGAGALAHLDVFAKYCLGMAWEEWTASFSIDPNHPGNTNPPDDLRTGLLHKIERAQNTETPRHTGVGFEGTRALAHNLRFVRWCRPFFNTLPYEEPMRQLTRALANEYGITDGTTPPDHPGHPHNLTPPYTYGFHQSLNMYEFGAFGGLDDVLASARAFLAPGPPDNPQILGIVPDTYEILPSGTTPPTDTVWDRNNSVRYEGLPQNEVYGIGYYGNMSHGVWVSHTSAQAMFNFIMSSGSQRFVNGNNMELDTTPKSLWNDGSVG